MGKKIKAGDRITFVRLDGEVRADTVRGLFVQEVLLEPLARNHRREAVILTEHSWCFVDDIVGSAPAGKQRRIKALPDYDTPACQVQAFRKVFYADFSGRIMRDACCDVFANRDQACVYWWMLARQGVVAFLSCGQDGDMSNADKTCGRRCPAGQAGGASVRGTAFVA